jgi:hypothetical protein
MAPINKILVLLKNLMFSPDTFYYFFRYHYGYPKKNNIILYPKYHGAKVIDEFCPYLDDGELRTQYYNHMSESDKLQYRLIFLHDQEPIMDLVHFGSTYQKLRLPDRNPDAVEMSKIIAARFSHLQHPIWCHSEKNSKEIALLNSAGIVDCHYWYHGLISLNWFGAWRWCEDLDTAVKSSQAKRFMIYARDFSGTREYRKSLIEYLKNIQSQVLYDWDRQKEIHSNCSATIEISDAVDSYVHIVAETIFDTSKQHLTEKVLKPIVMGQPFIIVAGPGSLEYLKSYGFQTFESVWDESYDLEVDCQCRMGKIKALIDRLSKMSDQEFLHIYQRIIPIIQHNRQWFYSDRFYNKLMSELKTNMDNAVNLCDEHQKSNPVFWFGALEQLLEFDGLTFPQRWKDVVNEYMSTVPVADRHTLITRYPKLLKH